MKRRLGQGAVADVVTVLGVFLVVGAVCGLIWWLAVDPAEFVRTPDGGGAMGEVQLSKRFDPDGWYSVIAVVAGFLSGLGLSWWRSRDFRLTTVLLVPGAALAAATMALVGRALGPPDPHVTLVHAPRGAMVPVELAVSATPTYLMWPIAVLFGALMVLWSSPRRDGPPTDALPPHGSARDEEPSSKSRRSAR